MSTKPPCRAAQGTSVPLVKLNPTKAAGREQVSMPTRFASGLWRASSIPCGSHLCHRLDAANNTIEEKSNRLVEVLLSSITPGS